MLVISEDSDVRMLGEGRPFLLELVDPSLGPHLRARDNQVCLEQWRLQSAVSGIPASIESSSFGDVSVNNLTALFEHRHATQQAFLRLHQQSEDKRKLYGCIVRCPNHLTQDEVDRKLNGKITNANPLVIQQQTPLRVLHRRALLTRQKKIHSIAAFCLANHFFYLLLETDAGTYIKEFVHGDHGRTQPSCQTLMEQQGSLDIVCLDVLQLTV